MRLEFYPDSSDNINKINNPNAPASYKAFPETRQRGHGGAN